MSGPESSDGTTFAGKSTGGRAVAALSIAQHRRQSRTTISRFPVLNSSHQDIVQSRLDKTLGRTRSALGQLQLPKHARRWREPLQLCRYHRYARPQHQHQLVAPAEPASVLQRRISLQPPAHAGPAGVRQQAEHLRGSRNHRQRSGPSQLGSARAELFQRHRCSERRAERIQSQSHRRLFRLQSESVPRTSQHHRRRRSAQAGVQRLLPAGPARQLHLYRRGDRIGFRRLSHRRSRRQFHRLRQRRQIFPADRL